MKVASKALRRRRDPSSDGSEYKMSQVAVKTLYRYGMRSFSNLNSPSIKKARLKGGFLLRGKGLRGNLIEAEHLQVRRKVRDFMVSGPS